MHFTYFKAISMVKNKKNLWGGLVYFPSNHNNNQNRNQFACLSFVVDPLNFDNSK